MYDENIFLSLSYKQFVISTIITLPEGINSGALLHFQGPS